MLKFTVHTDMGEKLAAKLAAASTRGEHAVAVRVAKDTSPFVPFLTESLDKRTRVDGNFIIYPGPSARMLYHGKLMVDPNTGSSYAPERGTKVVTDKDLVFNKSGHAQAQAYWFEASKAQNLDAWLRVAQKEVKKA